MGKDIRRQHQYQKNTEHKGAERNQRQSTSLEFKVHKVHRHQRRLGHGEGHKHDGNDHLSDGRVNHGDF